MDQAAHWVRKVARDSVMTLEECPSKPHPRPLSRGERGVLAEKVELEQCVLLPPSVVERRGDLPAIPFAQVPPLPPGEGPGVRLRRARRCAHSNPSAPPASAPHRPPGDPPYAAASPTR